MPRAPFIVGLEVSGWAGKRLNARVARLPKADLLQQDSCEAKRLALLLAWNGVDTFPFRRPVLPFP